MSDLDKAIRAELETNYWRASRANSIAADRGARAILSTLDLHTHTEVPGLPMRQCAACGLISRDQWCDTVNAIAEDLGVSGEDRSEPTPAPREPRVWREGDQAPSDAARFTDPEADEWTVHFIGNDGQPWLHTHTGPSFPWASVVKSYGPLTEVLSEVVTPEGTP